MEILSQKPIERGLDEFNRDFLDRVRAEYYNPYDGTIYPEEFDRLWDLAYRYINVEYQMPGGSGLTAAQAEAIAI